MGLFKFVGRKFDYVFESMYFWSKNAPKTQFLEQKRSKNAVFGAKTLQKRSFIFEQNIVRKSNFCL